MSGRTIESPAVSPRPVWHRWTPAAAAALFTLCFAAAAGYLRSAGLDPRLTRLPEFGLWTVLLAVVAGFASVGCLYGTIWLRGLRNLFPVSQRPSVPRLLGPILLVLGLVFTALIVGGMLGPRTTIVDVGRQLDHVVRPVSVTSGVLISPALAGFLAIRRLAERPASWQGSAREQILRLIEVRAELRRLLSLLGGFLTLIVVTTGMRRRALEVFNSRVAAPEQVQVPKESVLLYGATFAVVLGLFYLAAASALDTRAAAVVEAIEPFPDPASESFVERMAKRAELSSAVGGSGSMASFETAVVVASPLLTALLGIATT